MALSKPKHVAMFSSICLYNKVLLDQNLYICYSELWGGLLCQTSPTWVKKYGKYGWKFSYAASMCVTEPFFMKLFL